METPDLAHLEELLEKATPGPWVYSVYGTQILTGDSWNTVCVFLEQGRDHRMAAWEDGRKAHDMESNAKMIAALRNAAPGLIARIRELEEQLQRNETMMQEIEWGDDI